MNQQPIQGSKLQQATTKACPIDMPHLNLTMESPPVDSSFSNSKEDVTIKEGHGDAADKETKANDSRECFTTTLESGTSNNPGEHIATTNEPIHKGIATVKETLITNSTTETTPSNVEINCDNELSVGNECSSHDPNINDNNEWKNLALIIVIVIMENPYPMYQPHADHPIL
jgi:hypothetical protein